jgi:amino acid adenylation domain-containing protein
MTSSTDIAIIGMHGRFPQAVGVDELWGLLRSGTEAITEPSEAELLESGIPPETLADPGFVRRGRALTGIESFDAAFFGYSPYEAARTDPQQRLFLETCWQALEVAGYGPRHVAGHVGVFAGADMNSYLLYHLRDELDACRTVGDFGTVIGNDKDYLATRVSYKLGLSGPCMTVQSACSTSLVAVHLACQSLIDGQCDLALAGGSSVTVPQVGYLYREDGIVSPDGRCLPFTKEAAGTVFGNGVAAVVLKPLSDALRDGDTVWAVIKGSAVNNDGGRKVGFTAPSVDGQAAVISEALAVADVDPGTVGYLEAHGTATPLGDAIEVSALHAVFGQEAGDRIALGSIKANLGHLGAAAGVAGLMKVALAMRHGEIPPNPGCAEAGSELGLEHGPFYLTADPRPWPDGVRRAGVSSFGIGGTNAHLLVEEATKPPDRPAVRGWQVLPLDARTEDDLARLGRALGNRLDAADAPALLDAGHTLRQRSGGLRHRRVLVARETAQAADALCGREIGAVPDSTGIAPEKPPPVVFLLAGGGAQHPRMASGLYDAVPAFRRALDECAELFAAELGRDFRDALLGGSADLLLSAGVGLPALFSVQYALAQAWEDLGVRPAALLGHSLGECVAACLSGVADLPDAVLMTSARIRALETARTGAMLRVQLSERDAASYLGDDGDIAVINESDAVVVSAEGAVIDALADRLTRDGVECDRLRLHTAAHSRLLESSVGTFVDAVRGIRLHEPRVPFVSNLTGEWIEPGQATDPEYWGRQLRNTVRFSDGVATVLALEEPVYIELGPGAMLTGLLHRHPDRPPQVRTVTCLPGANDDTPGEATFLAAAGRAWTHGLPVDLNRLSDDAGGRRVPLPPYPFSGGRHWIPVAESRGPGVAAAALDPSLPATSSEEPRHDGAAAPRTEMERLVAGVWEQTLGHRPIGRTDRFFDLGGDSLIATRVVGRLVAALQTRISVKTLFATPTVAGMAQTLDRLMAERGDAPSMETSGDAGESVLIGDRGDGGAEPDTSEARIAPLSFAQQRVWFIEQLIPGTSAYNMAYALEVEGELSPTALRAAVNTVVRRHGALRSTFAMEEGTPVQRIAADLDIGLAEVDLSEVPDGEVEERVRTLAVEHAQRRFDLAAGPLLRVSLLRVRPGVRQVLLLAFHHLIFDGWSKGIFMSELAACYSAELDGTRPELAQPPADYADYARWQRDGAPAEISGYWRSTFARPPAPLELPTDHPRPPVQSLRGGRKWFTLAPELVAALRQVGNQNGATLFMTLLAGYAATLHRYTGQDDLVIGTPVAGRDDPEWEGTIGFFVNTLPLRIGLSPDMTFQELLERTREVSLDALDEAEVPYDLMVREFVQERSLDRNPLFQTMFTLESTPPPPMELPGARLSVRPEEHPSALFDLMLLLFEQEGGLTGFLEYSTDLLEPDTAGRMAGHLETLLAGAAERPHEPISRLPLLTPAEHRRVTVEWNATQRDLGPETTLHELVEGQAERTPDAPAVRFGEQVLTYAELDARAEHVAAALQERGVRPGSLVGVLLERSVRLLPAILGVLKAGAAYLPLEPGSPASRLDFMVADSGADLVISEADEEILQPASTERPERRRVPGSPGDRAYVIYTSGSTGTPKGVEISHRAIVNRLRWMQEEYRLTAGDRVMQKTPIGFDVSVWELFWPLIAGAQEVLLEPGLHRDPEALLRRVRDTETTVIHFVPSMLRLFLAAVDDGDAAPTRLRLVVCSGEALPADLVRRFHDLRPQLAPDAELHNLYGPTEAAVDVSAFRCTPQDGTREPVPIGRPIANCTLYVLDPTGRPAPVGVPGELFIGGVQVADGYLGRPELTRERFVPDPFAGGDARMYRTGDRARWRADGMVEFLGRADRQIKIRGQRIELGEIEHVAAGHPSVEQAAAVVVRQDASADAWLALYLQPAPGADLGERELRSYLRDRLPGGMLPRVVRTLPAFPLSPNGKIDYRALADLAAEPRAVAEAETDESGRRPDSAGSVQETLARIWQDMLGSPVAVDDNFFEVGGDSILCVRVVQEARQAGLRISPQDVFQHQTIAELAEAVSMQTGDGSALRPVREAGGERPVPEPAQSDDRPLGRARAAAAAELVDAYPLTPLQDHMARRITANPEPGLYVVQRVFHVRGSLDVPALERAWAALIDRHAALRTSFRLDAPGGPLQTVHRAGRGEFGYQDLRQVVRRDEILEGYLREDRSAHWDLLRPAPMRLRLFEYPDGDYRFVLTFNYMLVDGWSLGLLMGDLFTLYRAERTGRSADLPEPPAFRAVAEWLSGQPLDEARSYWRGLLGDGELRTSVQRIAQGLRPVDAVGADSEPIETLPFTRQHAHLDAAHTRRLSELAREWRVTVNILVQAAWAILITTHAGERDAVFGVTSSGRGLPVPGIAAVVGPCINTLPTRIGVTPEATLREWLQEVQGRQHRTSAYEHVSLDALTEWTGGDGVLFDHYMVFQNLGDLMEARDLPGIELVDEVPHFHTKMEHPLRIDVFPGERLGLFLSYHRRLLADASVRGILDEFVHALTALAQMPPESSVGDLVKAAVR